jgi:hypothetical protein
MKPTFLFLVAIGLADTIGVLAAPVQQAWLNPYDQLEIRSYALVKRGRPVKEKLHRPGQYQEPVGCGYNDCIYGGPFISPSAVDRHWVQLHRGMIPNGWAEPKTVPQSNRGRTDRKYPLGESGASVCLTNKVNAEYPGVAAHLYAQRAALDLFTGHLHVPCAAEDKANSRALYQRRKAREAPKRLPTGPSTEQAASLAPEDPPEAAQCNQAKRRAPYYQQYKPPRTASEDRAKLIRRKRQARQRYLRRLEQCLVTDPARPSTQQAAPRVCSSILLECNI